ncbi:MAG: hypothetical protein ACTSQY_09355 [Candidatus Odinarchaeia archaeon]
MICKWCRQEYTTDEFEEHKKECLADPNLNLNSNVTDKINWLRNLK